MWDNLEKPEKEEPSLGDFVAHPDLHHNMEWSKNFISRYEWKLPSSTDDPIYGMKVAIGGTILWMSYYAPLTSKMHKTCCPVNINQGYKKFNEDVRAAFNAICDVAIKDLKKHGSLIWDRPKTPQKAPVINEWQSFE